MEFNEENIEVLRKDLTPSPPSPSPWQAEVITIEDDDAPADPKPPHRLEAYEPIERFLHRRYTVYTLSSA
ncbi:hypothetical protein E4U37_006668 [Claviceps purpurea]|nr:hypothetical protein E4U37_006668 [Claviceps purpurea]